MPKLNKDIIFLILKELQNDKKSLYSCLMVNRTWCKSTVPILWKNPCPTDNANNIILFNVILLHLSEESREILRNEGIESIYFLTETSQQPLFDYISFWRYLDLRSLEIMFTSIASITPISSDESIIKNEILKLLINRNTNFTHLKINISLFSYNSYQLHLIPGAEHCFSELKFLLYNTNFKNQNVLEGFSRISKSINKLEFHVRSSNISGIIKLIKAQKNLNDVRLYPSCTKTYGSMYKTFKTLEELLTKHVNTIQYLQICWKPITKILSHSINLISLNINISYVDHKNLDWSHLENVSLPVLKILKAQGIPSKSLTGLIEGTKGSLTEISIDYGYNDYKRLIQAIYQNCPNLMYIKLCLENNIISELEKLLTNCQCLNGLVITHDSQILYEQFDWDNLFKLLTKSSPDSLFKFKFWFKSYWNPRSKSLKLFFESWKGRHPMLLQTAPDGCETLTKEDFDLIGEYEREGIIKKYDNDLWGEDFEDFEWIQKKF